MQGSSGWNYQEDARPIIYKSSTVRGKNNIIYTARLDTDARIRLPMLKREDSRRVLYMFS